MLYINKKYSQTLKVLSQILNPVSQSFGLYMVNINISTFLKNRGNFPAEG